MSSSLSPKQFAKDSYRSEDLRKSPKGPRDDADRVYAQLSRDYPKHALEWVHDIDWVGPVKLPLDKIDYNEERMWKASKDKAHVERFVDIFEEDGYNGMKPVVAVERPPPEPGTPPIMVADGHHRAEAYQKMGKPVLAYLGRAKHTKGPWDYLHDSQFKDTGKDKKLYR